jgi:hypothetical protein
MPDSKFGVEPVSAQKGKARSKGAGFAEAAELLWITE